MISMTISTALATVLSGGLAAPPTDFEPTWESLETHPTPQWFEDGKFGIFIHWGVYSVPSFCDTSTYSEWYQWWLKTDSHGGKVTKFHADNYGADFPYRDFAPMFRAEMFDPAEWARIFKRAGAEYMVITSKHHDGFCLWDSEVASEVRGYPWNSVQTGPKRDLIADLFEACRAEGVRPGLYYSFMEWDNPLYDREDKSEYVDRVMIPQIKELVETYEPAVFWPDGEWNHSDETWRSTEILEWIYENCDNPEEIVVNDRWGRGLRGQVGDYTTTEYDNLGNSNGQGMRKHRPFEECRGIGHSFAFNRAEGYDLYDSRTACVQRLVDLVSRGGVLLLDIGPTADGRIPLIMVDRLLAIGDWLEVNGEAIKGTTRSPFKSLPWGRATAKGDTLYLHVFDWPEDDRLVVPGLVTEVVGADMLGDRRAGRPLPVDRIDDTTLVVDLEGLHPFEHATVIRLRLGGPPVVDESVRAGRGGVVDLLPGAAELEGPNLRVESHPGEDGAPVPNLGYWSSTEPTATWSVRLASDQGYRIEAVVACRDEAAGGRLELAIGEGPGATTRSFTMPATGSWSDFTTVEVGECRPDDGAAPLPVVLKALSMDGEAVGNVRSIRFVPIDG